MPIIKDETYREPKDDLKIWRFMDFTKFVSILDNNALYFTRSDMFEDPYEGSLTDFNLNYLNATRNQYSDQSLRAMYRLKKYTFVNCWHQNESQSAAMWKLYLSSHEGIAIQTTNEKIKMQFNLAEYDIYYGEVEYLDYEHEYISINRGISTIEPYFRKRISFEHEKEIRAVIQKLEHTGAEEEISLKNNPNRSSISIDINLNELIENIYIAPTAPEWFVKLVQSIVNKYNLGITVKQSNLYNSRWLE